MSVAENRETKAAGPPFRTGDRMNQPEFHRLYEQTPVGFRAELVEGIVYLASPMGFPHADACSLLDTLIGIYAIGTPGLTSSHDATVILDDQNEPQPDIHLRIEPRLGGQTSTQGKYLVGPPELVLEIADSTAAIDLTKKRDAYLRAGVQEYIVFCCDPPHFVVFNFATEIEDQDVRSIFRSSIFGGLWLDFEAILSGDKLHAMKVVQEGLASQDHQEFVRRLANRQA